MRPERKGLRPVRADFRPERADLRSQKPNLRPEGGTKKRTDAGRKVFYRTFVPFGAAAQKRHTSRKSVTWLAVPDAPELVYIWIRW